MARLKHLAQEETTVAAPGNDFRVIKLLRLALLSRAANGVF
jgi:hypothetical protein